MKTLAILVLSIFMAQVLGQKDDNAAVFGFVAKQTWYAIIIPESVLKEAPTWDLQSSPLLSPNDAFKKADAVCNTSKTFKDIPKVLRQITLTHSLGKHWYYLITYSVANEIGNNGLPEEIIFAVLFNGTVISGVADKRK